MRNLCLLFAVGFLTGCSKPPEATPAVAAAAGPVTVKVVSPKKATLTWYVDQPATAVAFESAPLVAKLPGYVKSVHVDIGDAVKAGQLLAELAIPELLDEAAQKAALVNQAKAQRTQAEKSIDVAKARVTVADAGIAEAEASVARADADLARWGGELERVSGLVGRKIIDSQTKDETQKQFASAKSLKTEAMARIASAKANRLEAEAMVGRAIADREAADANVAVAEADARRVAALVSYTKITAPFAGTVTMRNVHPGHFLQPANGAKIEQLFTVARTDTVRIAFDVPEAAALQVKVGTKATVRVPGQKGAEFAATIVRTSGVLSGESRTLRAEIDLTTGVTPGSYSSVRIPCTTVDAMTLPASAVQYADETTYAYEIVGGKVIKQRVRVGRTDAGIVEIVGKKKLMGTGDWQPLGDADKFATANLGALADGAAVAVE